MRIRDRRRRGAMYLAVLMTATIVAIIGLSALAATRVQLRAAEGGNNLATARFCAQSAIEMGFFAVRNDATWRTQYTHDTWVPEQTLAEGAFTWKLVDEQNGDLAADDDARVSLYGRGAIGSAVRICSAVLEPAYLDQSNWLSNPGFESGTTDWNDGDDCDLEVRTDDPHSGTTYLRMKNRVDNLSGPRQLIGRQLEDGEPYDTEAWLKMKDFTEGVTLVLWLRTDSGWTKLASEVMSVDKTWTRASWSFTPTWLGSLHEVYWKVETAWSAQAFDVDDGVLQRARVNSNMLVVPGTWRRVVE